MFVEPWFSQTQSYINTIASNQLHQPELSLRCKEINIISAVYVESFQFILSPNNFITFRNKIVLLM